MDPYDEPIGYYDISVIRKNLESKVRTDILPDNYYDLYIYKNNSWINFSGQFLHVSSFLQKYHHVEGCLLFQCEQHLLIVNGKVLDVKEDPVLGCDTFTSYLNDNIIQDIPIY